MKNYSISERNLLTNVVAFNCLIVVLFGLFLAFLSSSFDESIRFFGSIVFAVAIGLVLLLIHGSARILANRIIEEKKEIDALKALIVDFFKHKDIHSFVKETVDFYLKIKIDKIPEPMYLVLQKHEHVRRLFVKEITDRIFDEKNNLGLKEDASVNDVISYGLTLVTLNDLLKLLENVVSSQQVISGDTDNGFEKWPLTKDLLRQG